MLQLHANLVSYSREWAVLHISKPNMNRNRYRDYDEGRRRPREDSSYRRGSSSGRREAGGVGLQDYRRLKRKDLRDKNVDCIYRNTPSPSASAEKFDTEDSSGSMLTEEERELEHEWERQEKEKDQERSRKSQNQMKLAALCETDPVLKGLEKQEMVLFKQYVDKVARDIEAEKERQRIEEEEQAVVGPEPLYRMDVVGHGQNDVSAYGGHLRPGEGSAMAAYVQQGQRIPRRGEVGLDANEIQKFEQIGYVMSGNRNAKMNAIRMRKENQVYTAEEKAALAMLNFEENKKKEAKIIEDMKRLVEKTVNDAAK